MSPIIKKCLGRRVIIADKRWRKAATNFIVKHFIVTFGVLTLAFVLDVLPCRAFEKIKVFRGALVLEGKIVQGDYIAVRNFLAEESNFKKISGGVFLASPGGSVGEAMKIGHLIRALKLSTDAPPGPAAGKPKFGESPINARDLVDPRKNYLCTSACFLVYVAGVYRNLNWVGRLGIHRPAQLESSIFKLTGNDANRLNNYIHAEIKNYLYDMNVPEKYLELMFSVSPDKLRWITQEEFDSDLKGYIPKLRGMIATKCDPHIFKENHSNKMADCETQTRNELSVEAWQSYFTMGDHR